MADEKKKIEEVEEAAVEKTAEKTAEETPEAEAVVEEPVVEEPAVEETAVEETAEPEAAAAEAAVEEPVAEVEAEEPAAEVADAAEEVSDTSVSDTLASDAAVEAPPAKKQKSRKHVPRSERRKRSVPAREVLKERKPIVRLPKPEYDRAARQERRGIVISDKADKTIVVKVDVTKLHPRYKKVVRRSVKFHAHDETNQAGIGDIVRIVETRPLSKTKCWRLAEIVEKAK
jgi:small subunit ribosomal protein S17